MLIQDVLKIKIVKKDRKKYRNATGNVCAQDITLFSK